MNQGRWPDAAIPPDACLPARPSRGWVPIRRLGSRHRKRVLEHLLALDGADRSLRFGHLASDERILHYVGQLDFERDELFGIFDRRLRLVAMAHLAFIAGEPPAAGISEFGVSVLTRQRGRGLGSRLFEHSVMHARNRGMSKMLIHLARDNAAMLGIVRRAGASIEFEGCDVLAQLPLPADTLGSQIAELLGQQAAELDYRLKARVLRLNG
jgi:ribosomal protein S18 acetylase RimI-like enzyme